MKKPTPKAPKSRDAKPSLNIESLMETNSQIYDSTCPYHLLDLLFDMYDHHFKIEDPFRVLDSRLYYQISPFVYHFPKFVSWLVVSYVEYKKCIVSSTGVKILEITPELIQKALVYLVL